MSRILFSTILLLLFFSNFAFSNPPKGDYLEVKPPPKLNSLEIITFDEYFNFTCPHCNNFNKASIKLKEKHKTLIKINYIPVLFRNQSDFPLRLFYIAESKGKALEIKNLIFSAAFEQNVNIYDPNVVNYLARVSGLAEVYKKEGNADWVTQRIFAAQTQAEEVGVRATPTVVLAGSLLVSPKKGMNTFVANLDSLINQLAKNK